MTKSTEFSVCRTSLATLAVAAFTLASLAADGAFAAPADKVAATGAQAVLFVRKAVIGKKKKKSIITPIPVNRHERDCH